MSGWRWYGEPTPPPPPVLRWRWLAVGQDYRYSPREGRGDDARRGESCTVLTLSRHGAHPFNVLVEFCGGHRAVVPWGVLRPLKGSR